MIHSSTWVDNKKISTCTSNNIISRQNRNCVWNIKPNLYGQYFVLKKFITLETILLLSGGYIWQHLYLVMERIMALQQNDWQEKHIFVYFVDFVHFFTWGKFCLWLLWRLSCLGQNLYNYEKPSAFVLKALVITAILLVRIGP